LLEDKYILSHYMCDRLIYEHQINHIDVVTMHQSSRYYEQLALVLFYIEDEEHVLLDRQLYAGIRNSLQEPA
jgi:hypothetical protein